MIYGSNYFEDMGLYYLGPIDGNDYESMEKILTEAKKLNESVLIHIKTVKGKGYDPAEESPDKYHGVAPNANVRKARTLTDVFGEEAVALADSRAGEGDVVILSPASTSFDRFKNFVERGNTFKEIVKQL